MFGWGRKKDGFEWHKYVRTTIKLRRDDRRARLLDAKEVAADSLKYAGRASVSAGSSGAVMAWNGLLSAIQMLIRGAIAGGQAMARTAQRAIAPGGAGLWSQLEPYSKRLGRSPLLPLLGVVGLVAFHAAFARSRTGTRAETILIAVVGTLALAAALTPLLAGHAKFGVPAGLTGLAGRMARAVPALGRLNAGQQRYAGIAAMLALVLGGGYLLNRSGSPALTGLTSFNPFAVQIVEGRAIVLAGDVIRINATAIRISGIEAPEAEQKCTAINKKKWACGEAARAALQRIVKSANVRCELSGTDAAGRSLGTCQTVSTGNSQDVGAALVKEGAVFSDGGLFSGYGNIESEAKEKKLGVWRGEAERPADYRAKLWEVAAKAAPDGCPIKGQVSGEAKTYVLPWQPVYGGAKVRPARGERWFCSESEAQAAGWKVAAR